VNSFPTRNGALTRVPSGYAPVSFSDANDDSVGPLLCNKTKNTSAEIDLRKYRKERMRHVATPS